MQGFTQYTPTKIIFGKETELQVGKLAKQYGATKVLVVYGGGSVVRSGLLSKIESALQVEALEYMLIGGVTPNPRLSYVRETIKDALAFGTDFIVAVGGGSVIDACKAIAHGVANPETDVWEFWDKKKTVQKTTPVGVVLTISAAGSEMSNSSVLTNEETSIKKGLSTDLNRPVFAIMNPELTYTLPKYQIACGIADIMMHTMERYFTKSEGNELTDAFAEAVLRNVIKNGRIAMKNPCDYQAMSEIMWAGSLSHNGLTGLGAQSDFATHQLGHELSAKFDIAHAASLTAVWGSWAAYVCGEKPQRFVQFGQNVWGIAEEEAEVAIQKTIAKTVSYFKEIGLPTCFSEVPEIGVRTDKQLWEMADGCSYGNTRTIGSFKVCKKEDIYEIYKRANH